MNLKTVKQPRDDADVRDDLALAQQASLGEPKARRTVNQLAEPLIHYQTRLFCQRFCRGYRYQYQCSLPSHAYPSSGSSVLCEWGNASYTWMLDDLTRPQRLQSYQGRHGASLKHYLYQIANSKPFYERWKDWRFGRRLYVPEFIQQLDERAAQVFIALRAGENTAMIAQAIGYDESQADQLIQKVITTLTMKRRLYLLDKPETFSLSSGQGDTEEHTDQDVAVNDAGPETVIEQQDLYKAWKQLTSLEKFVIEALVIDNQDASDVLESIHRLQKEKGILNEVSLQDRQQLYYFRRKIIAKLAALL